MISVITASYNYRRFISQTIESVLGQTYNNIQYIIVDDCSSDGSQDIIKEYARKDDRIKYIEMRHNTGGPPAYAEACKLIQGDYICCIDADDVIDKNKFEIQMNHFQKNADVDVLTTYSSIIDGNGNTLASPNYFEDWSNKSHDFNDIGCWLYNNYIAHSAVMMKKSAHDRVGPLDPCLRYTPDYEHWVRFLANGFKFDIIPKKLLMYRIHGENQTHKNLAATFMEKTYIFWKHVLPVLVEERRLAEIAQRINAIVLDEEYAKLAIKTRLQLLSLLSRDSSNASNYSDFISLLGAKHDNTAYIIEALTAASPYALEVSNFYNKIEQLSLRRKHADRSTHGFAKLANLLLKLRYR